MYFVLLYQATCKSNWLEHSEESEADLQVFESINLETLRQHTSKYISWIAKFKVKMVKKRNNNTNILCI